ncbi:MAG: hypothetical protein AAFQ77_03175 [Myxococcota bacterium]
MRTALCTLLGLATVACSDDIPAGALIEQTFTGTVSLGTSIAGARLSLRSATAELAPDELLAESTVDEDGAFTLTIPETPGSAWVCASGGIFADLVTGVAVPFDGELCLFVPDLLQPPTLTLNAWTHLVSVLTVARIRNESLPSQSAADTAYATFRQFLACADPQRDPIRVTPLNPLEDPTTTLTDPLFAGVLHAGLSQLAALISEDLAYTPGVRFTARELLQGLELDLQNDGVLDGLDDGDAIAVEGFTFSANTLRSDELALPQAIRVFLDRNAETVSFATADFLDTLECMASSTSTLFPSLGGPGTPGPQPGPEPGFDNEPPVVTITSSTLTPTGSYTLTGTATDSRSGVATVEVFNQAALLRTLVPADDDTFAAELSLACNTTTPLRIVATDNAENVTETQHPVTCNNVGPAIAERDARYLPATVVSTSATATQTTYTGTQFLPTEGRWIDGFAISKFVNRLDYAPEVGATIESNNLPVIAFDVSTPAPSEVADAIRYRYQVRLTDEDPWDTERDWTPLAPSEPESNSYTIPIALQTLSEAIVSRANQQHRIDVEVRDAIGNVADRSFRFTLDLLAPPVVVTDCDLDANTLAAYGSTAPSQLRDFYNIDASYPLATQTLRWNLDLPDDSLLPDIPLDPTVIATAETRIDEISFVFGPVRGIIRGCHPDAANSGRCACGQFPDSASTSILNTFLGSGRNCLNRPNLVAELEQNVPYPFWTSVEGPVLGSAFRVPPQDPVFAARFDTFQTQTHDVGVSRVFENAAVEREALTDTTPVQVSTTLDNPTFLNLGEMPFNFIDICRDAPGATGASVAEPIGHCRPSARIPAGSLGDEDVWEQRDVREAPTSVSLSLSFSYEVSAEASGVPMRDPAVVFTEGCLSTTRINNTRERPTLAPIYTDAR